VPLLTAVDTALVGHLPAVYFIGAVAIGSMIFNFVYWGFGFLRMGTTGLTAQSYGRQETDESAAILGRALLVALCGGLLIILFRQPIEWISFQLIRASADVEFHAREYYRIRVFAAPATLALYAFNGWFLGLQNARYPLILTVAANLFNIAFSLWFLIGLKMNSAGVALGTVAAQYLGLLLAVFLMMRKYPGFYTRLKLNLIFRAEPIRRFFTVNFDLFLRTLLLIFTYSYFTAKSAEFGDDILAANTILIQLWMIFSYGIDGFAFASESLIGRFLGEANRVNLKQAIRYSFLWGITLGLFFTAAYGVFIRPLAGLFTDKPEIIDLVVRFGLWTILGPVISSFCYIWDGIFIGATASKAMRNSAVITTLIFIPAFLAGRHFGGNHGIWVALLLFQTARAVTLQIMSRKHIYGRLQPAGEDK